MIKTKKQSLIVIGAFALVMLLGTVTYAFFNYTRTGASNNIRVGRISFESKNEETITLSNLFPIDPENTTDMNDSTKVGTYSIDIKGDTDYVDGIEYLVSAVDANIYTTEGQLVPISLDITVDDLGTPNANYFTDRESKNANIYKKIVGNTLVGDGMLLVGYIKPNTTSGQAEGVDGSITIKAYLDKNKILISDTYDGTESDNMGTPNSLAEGKTVLTTSEWNALKTNGISFKVKVEANEGIWVKDPSLLYNVISKNAVMDNIASEYVTASTGINFGAKSSNTNGKGVYIRSGTENNIYPINYYRGDIDNNNVIFNNLCWKVVRTTDTGGVKLIYNGELHDVIKYQNVDIDGYAGGTVINNGIDMTFNVDSKEWVGTLVNSTVDSVVDITFKVSKPGNYSLFVPTSKNSVLQFGNFDLKKNGNTITTDFSTGKILLQNVQTNDEFNLYYKYNFYISSEYKFSLANELNYGMGCDNSGELSLITLNENGTDTNTFAFNQNANSLSYVGYMYGNNIYDFKYGEISGTAWSDVEYENGIYKLASNGTYSDSIDNYHHYICENSSNCTVVRYFFSQYDYIELIGGKRVEDVLQELGENAIDSEAKTKIDTWYRENMLAVSEKLEDTVWCNDRSMGNDNNGWISNGGKLDEILYYGAHRRSTYSTDNDKKNKPFLGCINKNDAFTVNNPVGNQKLTYPIALLTQDEIVLAGNIYDYDGTAYYLNNGFWYWNMTPHRADNFGVSVDYVANDGGMYVGQTVSSKLGLRPSVSLKHETSVSGGTGTVTNPYVIE